MAFGRNEHVVAENHHRGAPQPGFLAVNIDFSSSSHLANDLLSELPSAAPQERKRRKEEMKSKLFALILLAGASAFAGPRVFVGFGVGYAPAPVVAYAPPPPPVVAYVPPAPGPGYSWVAGYYAP